MPKKPIAYRGSEPFVFVSYAHADAELAYPIISGLQERGLRVWFDEGIEAGELWDEVIPDYVEQCAAMLCLVSTRFTDSKNCKNEIRYANELKKEVLILHLEDRELPRYIRFHYSSIHALRLSEYSDYGALLDKLAVAQKLRCCIGRLKKDTAKSKENPAKPKENPAKPKEDPAELLRKGIACYRVESYEEAVSWFRRAADMGNAEAMWRLGHCYFWGNGVTKSNKEAVSWFRWAADRGNAEAMNRLGDCYYWGNGVTKSYGEAVRWFRRAADRRNVEAMNRLSDCSKNGWGVPKDLEQAEYWRNKAEQTAAAAAAANQ